MNVVLYMTASENFTVIENVFALNLCDWPFRSNLLFCFCTFTMLQTCNQKAGQKKCYAGLGIVAELTLHERYQHRIVQEEIIL